MLEANRGYVAYRHAQHHATATYTDTTAGWYFTVYWPITPPEVFAT
jgi:hypothetical protein